MMRWWTGAALLAGWVGLTGLAWSQSPPALPIGPSMPEPLPVAGQMPQGVVPSRGTGMPSGYVPSGVPGTGGLNPPPLDNNYSAFTDENPAYWNQSRDFWAGCGGWYADFGSRWFERQRGGHAAMSLLDASDLHNGLPAVPGTPVLQSFHDLSPYMEPGWTGAVGYFWDGMAIEFSGFYSGDQKGVSDASSAGRIDSFFFNPPLGFEGDNGMWNHADIFKTTMTTQIYNAELNAKLWAPDLTGFNAIVGLRYFNVQERLQMGVDDDSLSFALDQTRQALYIVKTYNQLVAAQLGFEFNQPLLPWLGISGFGKGAWGANFYDVRYQLYRGDGFFGFNDTRSTTLFSQLYETGVFVDFYMGSRWHVKLGYEAMWFLDMPEVTEQVNYNLAEPTALLRDKGSIFWHGPALEFQVQF